MNLRGKMSEFLILQFPALIVLIPIIFAVTILVASNRNFANIGFVLSNIICFILICYFSLNYQNESIYSFGNWQESVAINFKTDAISLYILSLIYFVMFIYSIFLSGCFKDNCENLISNSKKHLPYVLMLFVLGGYGGLVLTNDIFNLYVFLEISSLASYPLFAISKDRNAYVSAFEYLIIGTIGATLILVAIGIILATYGTLNLDVVKMNFMNVNSNIAEIIFIVGVLIKLGVFPMHIWKTKSYTDSSSLISCFFISISSLVFIAIIYKFRFFLLNLNYNQEIILRIIAYLTLVFGGYFAIITTNYREIILFSLVSSVGYYILLLPFEHKYQVDLLVQFLFIESLIKLGLMMVPVLVSKDNLSIRDLINISKKNKYIAFILMVLLFNLASLPPSILFFNKLYFIKEAMRDNYTDIIPILISSVMGIIYSLRIARQMVKTSELEYPIKVRIAPLFGLLIIDIILIFALALTPYFLSLSSIIINGV
jgi:multicomponent Na+:H+ antiporter subunit D